MSTLLYQHLPKSAGVYQIYNYKLKKRYIGYSKNIYTRFQDGHLPALNNDHHFVKELQDDWNLDNTCWVVGTLEITTDLKREEYWINYYQSNITGYNIKCGNKHSDETRNHISVAHLGKVLSAKHKQNLSLNHYNKNNGFPEETKLKISDKLKGRSKTLNHKLKATLNNSINKLKSKSLLNTNENYRLALYSDLLKQVDINSSEVNTCLLNYQHEVVDTYYKLGINITRFSKQYGLDRHTVFNWITEYNSNERGV